MAMKQPLVSIISVFYNDKEKLKKSISSVLQQDYRSIEHIIVDGGSTDGSVDALKEAEKKYDDKSLKWISEKDKGISDAANKGLSMMKGKYFVFMTDPYCHSSVITTMVRSIVSGNYDGCYGGLCFVNSENRIIRVWSGKPGNWRLGWMPATPTFLLDTKYYIKYGGLKLQYKAGSDYEFDIRLFSREKNLKLVSIREPLVLFYGGGVSNGGVKGNLNGIKESYQALRENKVKFAFFTLMCKMAIAVFSYLFASRKTVATYPNGKNTNYEEIDTPK